MRPRKLAKSFLYAAQRLLPRKYGCIILGYHSIGAYDEPYTVATEEFEWQLQEIQRQGTSRYHAR
jgi:hypothetical protein